MRRIMFGPAVTMALLAAALCAGTALRCEAQEDPWGGEAWPPAGEAPADGEVSGGAAGGGEDGAGTPSPADAAATPFFSPTFDLYGSLATTTQAQLGDAGEVSRGDDVAVGSATQARLKGDWQPDERVLFHLELVGEHLYGVLNPYSYAQATGIDNGGTDDVQAANPQDDFADSLYLDQAWAQLRFDRLDLQLGKQPIAWGTGYAFNPTERTHIRSGLAGFNEDETPGTAAIAAGVPVVGSVVAEGYLAFEDRTHAGFTSARQADPAYLPWGGRLRLLIGSFDVAAGAIHEVVASPPGSDGAAVDGAARYLHVAAETVGSLGDLGAYAEAAWTMTVWDYPAGESDEWDPLAALESTVGLEYVFPRDIEAKLEYYRRGGGATSPSDYDTAGLFSGLTPVLARDYLFGYLMRTFRSYLDVTVAALANLNDGSILLIQQNEYAVSDNFSVSAAAMVPTGGGAQEFGGRLEVGERAIRLMRPVAIVGLDVSF